VFRPVPGISIAWSILPMTVGVPSMRRRLSKPVSVETVRGDPPVPSLGLRTSTRRTNSAGRRLAVNPWTSLTPSMTLKSFRADLPSIRMPRTEKSETSASRN